MRRLRSLGFALILARALPCFAQQIEGRFFSEKQEYLLGEPVYVILDIRNAAPKAGQIDSAGCLLSTWFEALTASHPRETGLYGCAGSGYGGDCPGSEITLGPGEHYKWRYLLEGPFRFETAGTYAVHAHHTVQLYAGSQSSAAVMEQGVESNFEVSLRNGSEGELVAAYEPVLRNLQSKEYHERALAISAVTQDPPLFLEKVVLAMADNPQTVIASIHGLKRLATPATKDKLADLAGLGNSEAIRQPAIIALGEVGDTSYCPLMLDIAREPTEYSRMIAARGAGRLCSEAALPTLLKLLKTADPSMRFEIAYALGNTQSRKVVPILIELSADEDPNVRRAVAEALGTLTHFSSGSVGTDRKAALKARHRWIDWWAMNGRRAQIFNDGQCAELRQLP